MVPAGPLGAEEAGETKEAGDVEGKGLPLPDPAWGLGLDLGGEGVVIGHGVEGGPCH